MGGWLDIYNKAVLVQLNSTGTGTGYELGKIRQLKTFYAFINILTWTKQQILSGTS